ncbi:MAG: hypothetical protein NTU53_10980 [Planctomycetota bacterium]|nr:hypothetical protein [Planctomycetota bacterium]
MVSAPRTCSGDWVVQRRLSGVIDPVRHAAVAAKLATQEHNALWWRDACLLYFQTFSQRPLPTGVEKPRLTLEEVMTKSLLDDEPKPRPLAR